MSNKPVPTHRFNSILALMRAARKYMTHLSKSNKRKSLDRYCDEMDGGMRDLVAHPAVFLLGGGVSSAQATGSAQTTQTSAEQALCSAHGPQSLAEHARSSARRICLAQTTLTSAEQALCSAHGAQSLAEHARSSARHN